MSTNSRKLFVSVVAATLAGLACPAVAQTSLSDAISSGQSHLDLRYRFEWVDQEGLPSDASASTLRVRLNYATGTYRNWSGFAEFDHVAEVFSDNFNSGSGTSSPRRNRYPVVADPNGSDLNQFYLQYSPGDQWQTRIGRQRILLDDQRYVGGVGWRQNEQTYDALSVTYQPKRGPTVFYSFIANVNRIFGSEVAAGDHQQDTHVLNVAYLFSEQVKLTGYGYLIDNDDAPAFSTRSLGLRLSASLPAGSAKLSVLAEYARQSDAGNSPLDFSADHMRLELGAGKDALSGAVGYELLGSDNGQGYRTPLATLHAFNGWADQFLATPGTGLQDLYLKFGYSFSGWKLAAQLHEFSADAGGEDFGSEIDIALSRKLSERYGLTLKLASFNADSVNRVDTTKAWLMLTANY